MAVVIASTELDGGGMDDWQALVGEHGLVSTTTARQAGMRSRDLAQLVTAGDLVHLRRGWYALASEVATDDSTPWERRRRLHAVHTWAVIGAHAGQVAASHHSALVLHDLPILAADLRQVHVSHLGEGSSRRRRGLTVHRATPGALVTDHVVDVATAVTTTVRTNSEMAALIAADAALHCGLVRADELVVAASRIEGPYASLARRVVDRADARAESPGETRLREALRLMGYVATPQARLVDGSFTAIVDFLIEEYGVAIEFDGFVKYGRRTPLAVDQTPADVVTAEKVREDHVRDLGYGMVRVIWRNLEALPDLRRRVGAAILRSTRLAG